ncbi:MAG: hypothetical protein QXN36_04090 [Candidatus Bathyarchaeia archaeon]
MSNKTETTRKDKIREKAVELSAKLMAKSLLKHETEKKELQNDKEKNQN